MVAAQLMEGEISAPPCRRVLLGDAGHTSRRRTAADDEGSNHAQAIARGGVRVQLELERSG
jgi:hypothetical protein